MNSDDIKDPALKDHVKRLESQHQQGQLSVAAANAQRNMAQLSMFEGNQNDIVRWQLDLSQELERIEHLLRGHVLMRTNEGDEIWVEPVSDNQKPFNEHGVQIIMNAISFYINKNTILSNYNETTINMKMENLGNDIADIIYLKYEEMGMNTPEKKRMYFIIVREIVDTIHSAYLRALGGEERSSLRRIMNISQIDNSPHSPLMPGNSNRGKQGFWQSLTGAR